MFKSLSIYLVELERAESFISIFRTEFANRAFLDHRPQWPDTLQAETRGFVLAPAAILNETLNPPVPFIHLVQIVYTKAIDQAAVKCEVEKKAAEIKETEGRVVSRKEKADIKDAILERLLPNAPVKKRTVQAFLTIDGYILIDATGKQAEDFLSHLREVLGSLPCKPFAYDEATGLKHFIINRIHRRYFDLAESDGFEVTGSFAFTIGNEKISIQNGEEETIGEQIYERLSSDQSRVKWCELKTDNATFRLTEDFQLKSISLELDYEPVEEDEDLLRANWLRFYLEHFIRLAEDLRLAVSRYTSDNEDECAE